MRTQHRSMSWEKLGTTIRLGSVASAGSWSRQMLVVVSVTSPYSKTNIFRSNSSSSFARANKHGNKSLSKRPKHISESSFMAR